MGTDFSIELALEHTGEGIIMLLTLCNFLYTWFSRASNKKVIETKMAFTTDAISKTVAESEVRIAKTDTRVDQLTDRVTQHQLDVAREYVRMEILAQTESRLLEAIRSLTEAVHALTLRLDSKFDSNSLRN
jgi:uncharacterized coiled-coil protein SlyX